MQHLLLWAFLLTSGVLSEACPSACQCNQPKTVFCLVRKSQSFPSRVPHDTISLYVFENGITSVEEDNFSGLLDLQLLDLSHNKLSSLPGGVFNNLANLSNLDLSANELSEISAETFQGLGQLERLYLNENRIRIIHPDAFRGLGSLLELKLRQNLLTSPPAFSLPQLLLLDLSYNIIPAIQPGDFIADNIETLGLAGLGLKEVPKELLAGLKNLHELDISENNLDKVPSGLHGLNKLNLAGNVGISQLHTEDFSGFTSLWEVDLSRLSLRTLPKGLFRTIPRLRAVSLAQNPLNCVCSLSWLTEWLRVSRVSLQRPDETRCHFPPKNAGKTLRHLRDSDYGCPPPTTTVLPTTMGPGSTTGAPRPTEPLHAETPTTTIATTTYYHHQVDDGPTPSIELCPPHTCLNGGFCSLDAFGQLNCKCSQGYYGLYCEIGPVTTSSAEATKNAPGLLQLLEVTSTSIKVDLQSYNHKKDHLRGMRLTVLKLSGADRRPLLLSLPHTLSDYTVRRLVPNSTYWICLGYLDDDNTDDELCTEAQTAGVSLKHTAQVIQSQNGNLTLALVSAVAAVFLLSVVVAIAICYARRRRLKGHADDEVGPLEMEGVKMGLEWKGEMKLSDLPAGTEREVAESEEQLMEPTKLRNNNHTPKGRLPHSYC